MQIGDIAERTGLSIRTLRHYDEVGLVPPSERSAGGFRLYTEVDLARLIVIRRMKPLEFTLDEMRRLLDSLDTIDAGGDGVEDAERFVDECHSKAEAACENLRRKLSYAEELTELLDVNRRPSRRA
ncbi:MerR family transcriptional regulator [Rhodococcoides kyotonense]|uniref:MerR HTH family regulatory protein n=1 Tax=Rhodococcoides kyotonense TaxID=398843 RepID=A0A239I9V9_9NOCA|nr:MerR family transcriptional regulator [Rhodococcus kyotonensis]SNS89114.1 MerR HTH family regulatory protein [Rhodococcus kyotonensis]